MQIPRGDHFAYRNYHKLKEEYRQEMEMDLFLICFNIDRTKDFPNRAEYERDKMLLREKLPKISDNYLIDLCNECITYENVLALNILAEEITKRNSVRVPGNRILFYKERKNEDEYLYAEQ